MPGELPTPTEPLYRIGRGDNPLAFPPFDKVGNERFDDPITPPEYRVLYAGERLACLYEVLAEFRIGLDGVASQGITPGWLSRRAVGRFTLRDLDASGRWLDYTVPETFASIRRHFSAELLARGYSDFDLSVATNNDRGMSQLIGRWAYESGYRGIRYATRHTSHLACWAIFEGADLVIVDAGNSLTADDPDLLAVAAAWNLPLPSSR